MRHLTPEQIYWITLVGIAACAFVGGFAAAMLTVRRSNDRSSLSTINFPLSTEPTKEATP